MSDHETNLRKSKATTIKRHARTRTRSKPSATTLRNKENQDRTRDTRRTKSTCDRVVDCIQKFTPSEPQFIRHIRSFVGLFPSWRRPRGADSQSPVKYKRAKSKRQLQFQKTGAANKRKELGANLRESYQRLTPFLDLDTNQNVVKTSEQSGDSGVSLGDYPWQRYGLNVKPSGATVSCSALEPSADSEHSSSDNTPDFPPPSTFKDRRVTTPHSLPRITRPASANRPGFRSIADICPRRVSNSDFSLNKISKPHMTPKKSRLPPPIPPWPDEGQIVPVFHENQPREQSIRPNVIRPIPVNPIFLKSRSYRLRGSQETSDLTLNFHEKSSSKIIPVVEHEPKAKKVSFERIPEVTKAKKVSFEKMPEVPKAKNVSFERMPEVTKAKKVYLERMPEVPKMSSSESMRKAALDPTDSSILPMNHEPKLRGKCSKETLLKTRLLTELAKTENSVLHKLTKSERDEIKESTAIVAKWGKVKSLYIPSKTSKPSLKGPSFVKYAYNINWNAIDVKHAKAELAKNKLNEEKAAEIQRRHFDWEQRRRIALYKKRLQDEQCVPNIKIQGELESRFHLIHSFVSGHENTNQVGRYFDTVEGRLVAIKIFGPTFPGKISERLRNKLAAYSEITALVKMTDCYNIVQMITYFELDGRIHLILECCDHNLRSEIEKAKKGVHPKMAQKVTEQILNAVAYCHIQKCLHCDISPENLLVTKDGVIKLADFDKSIFLTDDKWHDVSPGTITYGAPELLMQRCNYGLSADIWSVGCVVAELLKGSPLWNYNTTEEQLLHILNSFTPSFPEYPKMVKCSTIIQRGPERTLREMLPTVAKDAMSFVSVCLNIDSAKRSTCAELLQHPYLRPSWDTPEHQFGWNSMTAILPHTPYHNRSHSAPTSVMSDTNLEDSDFESNRHLETGTDLTSDVSATTAEQTDDSSALGDQDENAKTSRANPMNRKLEKYTVDSEEKRTASVSSIEEGDGKESFRQVSLGKKPEVSTGSIDSDSKTKRKVNRRRRKKRCKKTESDISSSRQSPLDPGDMDIKIKLRKRRPESISARMPIPPLHKAASRQVSYESTLIRKRGAKDVRKKIHQDVSDIQQKSDLIKVQDSNFKTLAKLSSSQICALTLNQAGTFPTNNKSILMHIIGVIPQLTSEFVDEVCSHLNRIVSTSPKMFNNHVNVLVTVLLEQISQPKTRVACPAIKILETLYEITPKSLNGLAEKIMDCIMAKFGGPIFIENPCCNIMTKIVENIGPSRLCCHLAKIGPLQRLGLGRAIAAKFLCDSVRRLVIDLDLGDSTRAQRSFTRSIFDAATKFIRDSHLPARDYGKELYCILIQHSNFWHLYLNLVPESDRGRVNKLLDEIRTKIITSESEGNQRR